MKTKIIPVVLMAACVALMLIQPHVNFTMATHIICGSLLVPVYYVQFVLHQTLMTL